MLALGILFWTIFLPTAAVHLGSWELSKLWYFGLIIVSYFPGHVLQSISRSWFINPNDSVLSAEHAKMLPLIKAAARKISEALDVTPEMLADGVLVRMCDETAVQNGQTGDRDVFITGKDSIEAAWQHFVCLMSL